MAKDPRALREEAAEATSAGKYKKALAAYLELERIEPRDAQWAKRAGETYKRLGNNKNAIEAFERSAERYAQNGFLVQAIAVCKLILQIDPQHADTLRRLSTMSEQVGAGPTRAAGMAENNPALHEDPNVQALRRASTEGGRDSVPPPIRTHAPSIAGVPQHLPTGTSTRMPAAGIPEPVGGQSDRSQGFLRAGPSPVRPAAVVRPGGPPPVTGPIDFVSAPMQPVAGLDAPSRPTPVPQRPTPVPQRATPMPQRAKHSTPPPVATARTKSRPIELPPGAALDEIELNTQVANSRRREASVAGVHIIPLDDEDLPPLPLDGGITDGEMTAGSDDVSSFSSSIEIEIDTGTQPRIEIEDPDAVEPELDEIAELDLEDLEEIPMAQPRDIGVAAARALAATPLFAGLPSEALEALVANLSLIHLEAGQVLFREGDPGDALYVIAEGEVSVQAEGPPRVEMARLGASSFIGEVALMTDQPRSATVVALVDSELLRIDRHTLARVLGQHGDVLRAVLRFVRDRLVDRWIRTSPLFRPFEESQREELAQRFSFLEIDANTKLIPAGARPDGLYIVLAGNFNVVRGGQLIITLGPGDLIGETALLSGGAFRSDVIAVGKSLALCLPAPIFREVIMTHPHILEYIGEHAENARRLQIL